MRFRNRIALSGLVLALSLLSCAPSSHTFDPTGEADGGGGGGEKTSAPFTPDYATIKDLFERNRCLECHTKAKGDKGGVNLEGYANAKMHALVSRDEVEANSMPIENPKVTAEDKALLRAWVAAGMPETVIDFANIQSQILTPHCVKCHKEYAQYAKVALELKAIKSEVETNRMPKRAAPLSDALKALLADWILQGAPEFGPNSKNR